MVSACGLTVTTSDLEGGCPRHLPGPELVKIESASGAYCIDTTEVSTAHYQAFFDAQGSDAQAHIDRPGCGGVMTLRPDVTAWPVRGAEDLPVVRVNWCQATAYCLWAGKRLCGKVGGGSLVEEFLLDPSVSQWLNACSHGGTRPFPNGANYDATLCGPAPSPTFVTTRRCEGGFPGLYDMGANVREWVDTCPPPTNGNSCFTQGAAFDALPPDEFRCTESRPWTQTSGADNIGFRCCKDL